MTPDFLSLSTAVTQHLRGGLLGEIARALTIPRPEAEKQCATTLPALVQQLAQPISAKELDARWDICRQLFANQVLTDVTALVRTDLGWPERRAHLAQELLGATSYASLTAETAQSTHVMALLGYLTVVTLAAVGEQAHTAALGPAALGAWLSTQQVPTTVATPLAPAPDQTQAPKTSVATKSKLVLMLGAAGVAAIGGAYLLAGTPVASASQSKVEARAATAVVAASPAEVPVVTVATPATAKTAPVASSKQSPVAAAVPVATPVSVAIPKAAPGGGLRDTVGNAAMALHIGGKFDVGRGRYLKGEGQPLTIKLLHNADLTVSINSTESLLYKRLVNSVLTQPGDIGIDRLTFEVGNARLGAEGAQQLGSIAQLLKTFPHAHLLVMGHAYNKEPQAILLGLQRANAAVDELVKQGISADRLQAQGRMATSAPTGSEPPDKLAALQGVSLIIRK